MSSTMCEKEVEVLIVHVMIKICSILYSYIFLKIFSKNIGFFFFLGNGGRGIESKNGPTSYIYMGGIILMVC